MAVVTVPGLKTSSTAKSPSRPISPIKWHTSQGSSDFSIEIGDQTFAVNKILVSRSGRIRRQLMEAKNSKACRINLSDIPGGAEAMELAVKFCHGISVEITLQNAATLYCAARYLEMTEEFGEKNLEHQTEAYLKERVFSTISSSIAALHACESLLPVSEETNLVNRLIDSIVDGFCRYYESKKHYNSITTSPIGRMQSEDQIEWLGRSFEVISLDFIERVLSVLRSKGFKQEVITRILMIYAHRSLHHEEMKERIIVERIAGLLPHQSRNSVPVSFLVRLLKHALAASASSSCISDLERRIGLNLDQVTLEDTLLLTSSHENSHYTGYQTESVSRIFSIFLKLDEDDDDNLNDDEGIDLADSREQGSVVDVSKLLDSYLAEIALDPNLIAEKFIALTDLLPDHSRNSCDGLYRAVDTYLKIHPSISDTDRRRLCRSIEIRKLSQEACSHAAQNDRLPVQMTVQVLFFEQSRLRNEMNSGQNPLLFNSITAPFPQRSAGSAVVTTKDDYASVRRENRELKLEVARMRVRLTELEKDHISMKEELLRSHPTKKMLRSFGKKLGKLHGLFNIWDHHKIVDH